jgi:hypothetical protein
MTTPTTPVMIDLGDGVQRRIRYTVAVSKKLHEQYGGIDKVLSLPVVEFLPVLYAGIVASDRENLPTIEDLENELEMPQLTPLYESFCKAFLGKTLREFAAEAKAEAAKNEQSSNVTTHTIQ